MTNKQVIINVMSALRCGEIKVSTPNYIIFEKILSKDSDEIEDDSFNV